MDANENIKTFMTHWIFNRNRLEYADVDFEPDFNIPLRDDVFNLYFGLKIEMMHNITSYEYDQELVDPFINHVTKYFCKGNPEHADYMLNWMAHIVQKPSTPTMVAVVIKSEQGIGKGLIFDILLGDGIFGQETYLQVKNVEGLLGHFNANIMNKLLVNVNEVSMTKAQANEVKSMITDKTISAEAKFLNKITVKNCLNFVLTSNNDYCVYLDEGNSDRRYFILEGDSSNANDQNYYGPFHKYCSDPKVHLEVYKFLKSRDISQFNPRIIIDSDEKAKYRMKAIPLPIQFVQYYIEENQFMNFKQKMALQTLSH